MRFWWVNHKQTHLQEIEGGYIWSPKNNRNGSRNQTYINLTKTTPGDIVYSYADGHIKAIGVVEKRYSGMPKPVEFGKAGDKWSDDGWLVYLNWEKLQNPFRPKNHLDILGPLLPEKHSPIQKNGNGNQGCYLASIDSELHDALIEITEASGNTVFLKDSEEIRLREEEREESNISESSIQETEKVQLIKSRRGQGLFKQRLCEIEDRCRVTGMADQRFLIASHIKPWCKSDNNEKLDGNNGLLLAPHVDKLFDNGWISFTDTGDILVLDMSIEEVVVSWGIRPDLNVGFFNPKQKVFLEFHRREIFRD